VIKIAVTSVYVEDQSKALEFYTQVLGFQKKNDIPADGADRWLTVASPEGPEGVELLLEPNGNPIAKTYQQALVEAGIPATMFAADDVHAEYARLRELGVIFTQEPTAAGSVTTAVFDDTCGNLIMLAQVG
jgi:catechol 2,3-dioxygenase-like lactoylglutathione lyase family enzyme